MKKRKTRTRRLSKYSPRCRGVSRFFSLIAIRAGFRGPNTACMAVVWPNVALQAIRGFNYFLDSFHFVIVLVRYISNDDI